MKKYDVQIKGLTPYLMARFDISDLSGTTRRRSGSPNTDDQLKIEYEKKAYKINGKYYIPATHILGCLTNAGKDIQIKGKKRANYSKPFASNIEINPEAIILDNQKPEMFVISGVNPNTKGRVLIARPRFNQWEVEFVLICEDDQISEEALKDGLDIGGRAVGIGSWRPEKRGKFGKFILTKFKEIKK